MRNDYRNEPSDDFESGLGLKVMVFDEVGSISLRLDQILCGNRTKAL